MNTLKSEDFWTGVWVFMLVVAVLSAFVVPAIVITHENNIKTRQMITQCYQNGGMWHDSAEPYCTKG